MITAWMDHVTDKGHIVLRGSSDQGPRAAIILKDEVAQDAEDVWNIFWEVMRNDEKRGRKPVKLAA